MDGPAGWPTDNPPNSDGLGVYHRTIPQLTVWVDWQPGPPIWPLFGLDPDLDPKSLSGAVANTSDGSPHGDRGEWNESERRKARPRSADGDLGVPIQRSSPSNLSSAKRGGKKVVWNEIEALLFEVEERIEQRPSSRRSTDREGGM